MPVVLVVATIDDPAVLVGAMPDLGSEEAAAFAAFDFPEKMLTPLYLPPSRLRRAASDCTISKVTGSMMAGWLCSTK